MTTFPVLLLRLRLPRMLCIMTPVFPRHVVSSLRGSSPASADARSREARIEGTQGENPALPPQTQSCIMHVYICSASCAVSWFFLPVFFLSLSSHSLSSAVSQAAVALQEVGWKEVYPMDFYSSQSLGPWAPNHPDNQPVRAPHRQVSEIKG